MNDATSTLPTDNPRSNGTAAAERRSSRIAAQTAAVLGTLLLIDAAVETVSSGSPVRWWAVGAVVLYLTMTAATWRKRLGWKGHLSIALPVILGLVAATAWPAGGLTDGIRLLGQPTTRVVAALVAAGVALACLAILREQKIPILARSGVAALAAYGAIAFVAGAIDGTPLVALLAGASIWQRLPMALQGAFLGGLIVLPLGLVASVVQAGLRRPLKTSAHAELWRVTAITTSVAIVLAAMPLPSRSRAGLAAGGVATQSNRSLAESRPSSPELNAALTNSLRAVEDGEREASRERWDPAYVVSRLGADPQRLFTWVRDNTFWIPYRGVLRGPVGVLLDRLGNSLDRAVLLATLLHQANHPVRLARGSLSQEQAFSTLPALFVARARAAPRVAPQSGDMLAAVAAQYQLDEASLRRTLAAQADSQAKKRARLRARVPDQARRIAAALGQRPSDRTRADVERAIGALQDHWWVQVREGDTWRDFDLLAPAGGAALVSPGETIDLDALPDNLRHQVIVRVVAEQWSNAALTERTALEQALRPADLIGAPITLQFTPLRAPTQPPLTSLDSVQGLRAAALDVHEWVPVLIVGRNQVVQSAVMDTGDLAKPGAEELVRQSGRDAAGFAKSAGDLFNPTGSPAAPSLSRPPSKVLTAAWIDYEIRSPGEPPQKVRRTVFDLLGPSARAAGQTASPRVDEAATLTRGLALMMATEILPIVCRFAPQYLLHLAAESLLANREILASLARGDMPDDLAHAQDVAKRLAPMPSPLHGLARARFEWSRFRGQIFIDKPNILTRHIFFTPAATGLQLQVGTDIVANDIGVDLLARDPFAIRLEQGVLDTNVEAILASDRPDAANAAWAFDGSTGWITLRAAGDPQLAALQLPDDLRQRIADDLAAGNTVVAPKAPVAIGADTFAGWWRVDPASGHALGLGRTGWGVSMVERAVILLTGAATMFFFEYLWCAGRAGSSPSARACGPLYRDRRLAVVDYLVVPVEAAASGCLIAAVWAAVTAFLIGLGGMAFGGGGSAGSGGAGRGPTESGGAGGGEPGAGGEPPDLGKTDPDLGDTLPGDPPSGGGRTGRSGNQSGGSSGKPSGAGGEPVPQSAEDAAKAWSDADRRFWEAERVGDRQGQIDAIRDMIRANDSFPEGWTQVRGKPTPITYDSQGNPEFGPPFRPSSPVGSGGGSPQGGPPCVGPGCAPSVSPLAKSIGGVGGTLDVLNKGGK